MKLSTAALSVLLVLSSALGGAAIADEAGIRLIMPDGQLRSDPVRVYLPDTEITSAMKPELHLVRIVRRSDVVEDDLRAYGKPYSPFLVAPNQTWDDEAEPDLVHTGTVLLFNLRNFQIPLYKTGTRVQPVLRWQRSTETEATEDEKTEAKTGERGAAPKAEFEAAGARVYLANGMGCILWTLLIVAVLLRSVWGLRRDSGGLLGLVGTKGGGLSMSLTQMALWTIAVGSVVLGFGLMRLSVPDIPDTLVLLMGGAATTAAVGHWQTYRWRRAKETAPAKNKGATGSSNQPRSLSEKLQSLLMSDVNGKPEPSLAKAQILFWTLIALIVFVVKSVLDGQLWNVPTQLVALMGVSQVSFLARNELGVRDDERAATERREAEEAKQGGKPEAGPQPKPTPPEGGGGQ